jgi:uncharacterized membrane protein
MPFYKTLLAGFFIKLSKGLFCENHRWPILNFLAQCLLTADSHTWSDADGNYFFQEL